MKNMLKITNGCRDKAKYWLDLTDTDIADTVNEPRSSFLFTMLHKLLL